MLAPYGVLTSSDPAVDFIRVFGPRYLQPIVLLVSIRGAGIEDHFVMLTGMKLIRSVRI